MNWTLKNILFFLAINYSLFAADPIGVVTASEGITKALNLNQELRIVSLNEKVYLGDMIVVGDRAKLVIKFKDGTILTLIQKTQFWIDKYHYELYSKDNVFEAELSNGGFRVLTGSIANPKSDNFKIRAKASTIGIRGTILEAMIEDGELFVHCRCGKAKVTNALGSKLVGSQTEYHFVEAGEITPPRVLDQRPEFFKPTLFLPPRNGLNCSQKMSRFESFIFENGVE